MGIGLKRRVPLYLAILMILLSTATVYTLTISLLPVERIGLWSGIIQNSNFSVASSDVKFKGPNQIVVTLIVKNNDASNSHQANVDVTPLDSNGNPIAQTQEQSTGIVPAGSTVTLTYTFMQSGITSQYASVFIQITDTA